MIKELLRSVLVHPAVRGFPPGAPFWWERHERLAREKGLLRRIHEEWARDVAAAIPRLPGPVLEVGSGGGVLSRSIPGLVSTDVFPRRGIRAALDAARLPARDASLRGIVLVNVFHHLPRPGAFLAEAGRALGPGGRLVLLEPWMTRWSRFVYARFHSEPCDPDAPSWDSEVEGPMAGANEALAWIVFGRDRARLERDHPALRLLSVRPTMPAAYLVSGGVSMRSLAPGAAYPLLRAAERAFEPGAAMFATIVLEKRPA